MKACGKNTTPVTFQWLSHAQLDMEPINVKWQRGFMDLLYDQLES